MQSRFIGSYEIVEKVSPVNYRLKLPFTVKIHPVFHVSLLKKYIENPEEFSNRVVPPPMPIQVDGEEEFEVERILDKRIRKREKRGTTEYLVKWKGYPDHDATWESKTGLIHAEELVKEFEEMSGRHF